MTDPSEIKPPPRLLDDPSVAPDVQEGLSQLSAQQLPFDSAAGLSSLQSALSGAEIAGAAAGSTTSLSTGALVAGGIALVLAGAGMFAWLARSPEPKSPPAPSAPAELPEPQPAEVAPDVPTEEPAPSALHPTALPDDEAPERRAIRSAPSESPLEREVAQVVRAKALVDDDPRAALGVLARLEREHPGGALLEERAGLRVLALWKAGEIERAKAERAAFLSRYPSSPMRERLAQLEAP